MTEREAKEAKVGSRVKWRSNDHEYGRIDQKHDAGVQVIWSDGTVAMYLYVLPASLSCVELVH